MSYRTQEINGKKLRIELDKLGLTAEYISNEIGYQKTYIDQCIRKGHIARPAAMAIHQRFGVPFEAYKVKEEADEPKAAEPATFDYDALYKVIAQAVYDAVKKAWNE